MHGGGGDVLQLLRLDASEAQVQLGEAGLVAGGVGTRELGADHLHRPGPRTGGEVQADQLLGGVAVAGALLERLAVEDGRLVDVVELILVQLAELDQRGRHGATVVPAQVLDAPAQQRRQLGVRAEALVQLAQVLVGPHVLRLGLQGAHEGVGGLGPVLDAVVPQLISLERQLADLGRVADRRGVQHQQAGERGPVLGLAQAATRAQESVVAARRLAVCAELHRLSDGRRRQRAGQVFQRGGVRGRSGEVHEFSSPEGRERTSYHAVRSAGKGTVRGGGDGYLPLHACSWRFDGGKGMRYRSGLVSSVATRPQRLQARRPPPAQWRADPRVAAARRAR